MKICVIEYQIRCFSFNIIQLNIFYKYLFNPDDDNILMKTKLDKYSKYISLSLKEKMRIINSAKINESDRGPNPQGNLKFQEEDFIKLAVFDSYKQEMMYKLKTYRQNPKKGSPKAVVAMFHGLHSHVNRGAHIAHYFAERGIATVGLDSRGFGASEGHRGYIQDFETHVKDSQKFINLVKTVYKDIPLFPMGLSLGGATAYHLVLRNKQLFDGAVLMAPALMPSMKLTDKIGTVVNAINILQMFLPNQARLFKVKLEDNCRNSLINEQTVNDELFITKRVKLRTINSIFSQMQSSPSTFSSFDSPFMVVQGGTDKLINPQVAFQLFQKSKTAQADKQILFYQDMWHDIWHDKLIGEINQKMADWILDRAEMKYKK